MRAYPQLMLVGTAAEALAFWADAVPGLAWKEVTQDEDGQLSIAEVSVGSLVFRVFDSPIQHDFGPTPSWSVVLELDKAEDVDRIAAALSEAGTVQMPLDTYDFARRFAFVTDRFSVSWQVIAP